MYSTGSPASQATCLYVFTDDSLKAHPDLAAWRSSPDDTPASTDAEALTVGLMEGSLGVATPRKTSDTVRGNIPEASPQLPGYKRWPRRRHAPSCITARLVEAASLRVAPSPVRLYPLGSKPMI